MSRREETSETLRSAVILHGLVHRSVRHTVGSLRDCVIVPLERLGPVDVFYHSWDVAEVYNPRGSEDGVDLDPTELARWLPEAQGVFESQEEFDASVDWEPLLRNNPMRHCCGGEEEARVTLMNFRRALESQERAWRFFEKTKTRDYDVVVVTRGDLRFLVELGTSNIERSTSNFEGVRIWVPKFHSWGGVNDRFAIGNEEAIRIWSNRVAFAEQWLEKADGESAEWLLMKWLEKKRVRVGFLDFVFQRIRANGEVAERDQELDKGKLMDGRGSGQDARATVRERFLILARVTGGAVESLRKVLEPLGKVEVVVDRWDDAAAGDCRYVRVADEEAEGYGGLMSTSGPFPKITAWSRAMVHLARTLEPDEAVWFVEDDVAGDAGSFAELVRQTIFRSVDLAAIDLRTRQEDGHWPWWGYADNFFEEPMRGFQPLCRLSARLVRTALDFREKHGRFTFHEVLFPSLARQNGMTWLDWTRKPDFQRMFGTFRYRPEVSQIAQGISHPVKNLMVHEKICCGNFLEFPRLGQASLQGWAILPEDYLYLARLCRKHSFTRVVEFGPGDSTRAFLDAGCEVVSYEHDIGWLHRSVEMFKGEDGLELIHCPEGTVPDALPFAPDMVFVDGPPFREGQEMSRLQPCEWALDVCGCFLLHDANRHGELATLKEMERRGMHVARISTRKGLAMVVDPIRRPEMIPVGLKNLSRYRGEAAGRWFTEDLHTWLVMLSDPRRPMRVLETGTSDGMSMNVMLDEIFPHSESEVHGVDLYDGEAGNKLREDLDANVKSGGHASQLHLYEGATREVLAWMIAGDGFWESFDFIYLNPTHAAPEMLADACQAWSLLKPGGILVLGGGEEEKPAHEAFLSVYRQWIQLLLEGKQVAVMKRLVI